MGLARSQDPADGSDGWCFVHRDPSVVRFLPLLCVTARRRCHGSMDRGCLWSVRPLFCTWCCMLRPGLWRKFDTPGPLERSSRMPLSPLVPPRVTDTSSKPKCTKSTPCPSEHTSSKYIIQCSGRHIHVDRKTSCIPPSDSEARMRLRLMNYESPDQP